MVDFAQMFGLEPQQLEENQESENVSYGEKLGNSVCGMCFGVVLFFSMLGLSAWNEFNNVANQKTINAARDEYVVGTCSPIMSQLEGALVHVTCPVSNLQVLGQEDPVLQGIPEDQRRGLSLESYMEVLQWDETATTKTKSNKVGGGDTKVTTYTYNRIWSTNTPQAVTSFFKQGESCKTANGGLACLNWNPSSVESSWWSSSGYSLGTKKLDESKDVQAGDYIIPKDKIGRLGKATILTPKCRSSSSSSTTATPAPAPTTTAPVSTTAPTGNNNTQRDLQTTTSSSSNPLSCSPGGDATLKGSKLYWQQQDSNGVMIDYLSRSYSIRTTDTVSILAEQRGNSFVSWTSPYDDAYYVYEVVDGNQTADEMLADLEAANVGLTWFLRFFTLIVCIVGLVMITAPLTVIPDIIPCVGPWLGDLIGAVLWAVNCLLGCCCWSFITAIAWIAYRPIVGIPLLVVSCCLCAGGGYLAYANHQKKQQHSGDGKKSKEEEEDVEVAEEYVPDLEVPGDLALAVPEQSMEKE